MSDHPFRTLLAIFAALFAGALLVVVLADVVEFGPRRMEVQRNEFRQACAQAGGKAVFNGRHLECIK